MDVPLIHIRSDDREIVFETRVSRNWILVGFGGLMVAVALAGHGPGKLWVRLGALAVGSVVVWLGLHALLWRARLALDLVNRQYQRDSGYIWHIGAQTGSLDEVEAVVLSTEIRGGGRSGTYTVWVVELRFRKPFAAASIEGLRTEAEARELITSLTRALHVPFLDRTVQPTRQVDWKDVATPLVGRASKEGHVSASGAIPPAPPASGIELSHAGLHSVITLPPPGLRADALLVIAFTSAFLWIGYRTLSGMVSAIRAGTEHYWLGWVIGSLLFLIGLSGVVHGAALMLAREYVHDEGDTLVLGRRIWGVAYGKAMVAKDAVMDVAISPAQSAEGDSARALRAMREMVPSIGNWQVSVAIVQKEGRRNLGVTLKSGEQQWLVDALRAMCESRA
jgi:hypothetical protein